MEVKLPYDASSMMKVVRSTIINAMPSRPSVKRMPHDGIHQWSYRCCQASSAGSKAHQRPIERMNSSAKKAVASRCGPRAVPDATSSSPSSPRRPVKATSSAPIRGTARSAGRIQVL
jgi:hypothetical protein